MDKLICIMGDSILFFEYVSFFYIVLCRDFRETTKKKNMGIMACVLIWLLGEILGLGWDGVSLFPISVNEMLMFLVIYLLFDSSLSQYAAMAVGEYFLLSIMGLSLLIPLKKLNVNDDVRTMLCNGIVVIIVWIYYFCACKNKKDNTIKLSVKMWWFIDGIVCVLTLMMAFFAYIIVDMIPYNRVRVVGYFVSIFGSVVISILLFALLYYYDSSQEMRLQKKLVEMENEQQRIYFKGLLDREEETRSFRHDIIDNLLEIKNFSLQRQYEQLTQYIDSTLGEIMDISKSSYDVGNEIVNTILNYYFQPVKKDCDIEVTGYMSNEVIIEERDLCTVCANLVKNATEHISGRDGSRITFDVEQGSYYLVLTVENTYNGTIITDKAGNVITKKADKKNHGIGIHNVKKVVSKYEGRYEAKTDDNIYRVKVYFKL